MAHSLDTDYERKKPYTAMYITEPPEPAQSFSIRISPVSFRITYDKESGPGQGFTLTEKFSLFPDDKFYEGREGDPLGWTIEEGLGTAGLLFRRSASQEKFAVFFGISHDEIFWSEIIPKVNPISTLSDELMGRYSAQERREFGGGAGTVYDRVTVPLSGGEYVSLVAKKCIISSRPGYKLDITVFKDSKLVNISAMQ